MKNGRIVSKGPLTDKHLDILNKLIASTAETAQFCQQCHDCGIDVAPEARKNQEQQEIAMKLKAKFFPNAK